MRTTKITCDICPGAVEMKMIEKLGTHRTPFRSYRKRRFECPVCGCRKLVMGDGSADEKYYPEQGIQDAKDLSRQEEENRDF